MCLCFVFLCVHACNCSCMHTYVHVESRGLCWKSSSVVLHLIFWVSLSMNPEITSSASGDKSPRDPLVSTVTTLRLQVYAARALLFCVYLKYELWSLRVCLQSPLPRSCNFHLCFHNNKCWTFLYAYLLHQCISDEVFIWISCPLFLLNFKVHIHIIICICMIYIDRYKILLILLTLSLVLLLFSIYPPILLPNNFKLNASH